jgi:hypothetical protein
VRKSAEGRYEGREDIRKNEPKLHSREYRESLMPHRMKREAHKSQHQNEELTK